MSTIPAVEGLCDECGFEYERWGPADLIARIAEVADRFDSLHFRISDERLRRRPHPTVWSPLEYTCHVRDVLSVQRDRLVTALEHDRPAFPRTHMWQWPERDGYNAQNRGAVLGELRENASALAAAAGEMKPEHWDRRLVYSYPEPAERTVLWLLRHTAHEAQHHEFDIARIVDAGTSDPR